MINSTLCYIKKEDKVLLLYRNKKKSDANAGKWIGVGVKFEENEGPEDCLLREVKEETGLELISYKLRGIVTFVSDVWQTEQMFLFTSDEFRGKLRECNEGELEFVPISKINSLPVWQGDKIFLKLLFESENFFLLKLIYKGDELTCAMLDGKEI